MDGMFKALLELIKVPLRPDRGVKTDNSILLIYPPEKELDFREHLLDTFVPALEANKVPFRLLDLTGFLFDGLTDEVVATLQEDEFDDYRWMQQGLSKRAESCAPGAPDRTGGRSPRRQRDRLCDRRALPARPLR